MQILTEILLEITINIAPFHKSISHMDFLGSILKFGFFVHEAGNTCTSDQVDARKDNHSISTLSTRHRRKESDDIVRFERRLQFAEMTIVRDIDQDNGKPT